MPKKNLGNQFVLLQRLIKWLKINFSYFFIFRQFTCSTRWLSPKNGKIFVLITYLLQWIKNGI
jgi:hypothetical protein